MSEEERYQHEAKLAELRTQTTALYVIMLGVVTLVGKFVFGMGVW